MARRVETISVAVRWWMSDDWLAVILGALLLGGSLMAVYVTRTADFSERVERLDRLAERMSSLPAAQRAEAEAAYDRQLAALVDNPLKRFIQKPKLWRDDLRASILVSEGTAVWPGIVGAWLAGLILFGAAQRVMGVSPKAFARGYCGVFLLAVVAYVIAGQELIDYYNLEYALWALLVGLCISNTVGTPDFMRPAVCTELYIKTGLVLLGAEILFNRLLALGLPGVMVAWVVTPVVLVTTYLFGQHVLRMESKSLNMVISADMSVCGVSAAIATAAACRAKKEELSLAIAMSLTFTVMMMVVMPMLIRQLGMDPVLGGAWLGGTIDSTGAVAAAGEMVGTTPESKEVALTVAATVKMIQNILIGVVAFAVAVYWVLHVEKASEGDRQRPRLAEIWNRFPKFVLGFVGASIVFSAIYTQGVGGEAIVDAVIGGTSKTLRGWFFCLAFVSIGLESNFRELSRPLAGGKPLVLYLCGQSLNLCLTLLMAWLMFVKVFPDASALLLP